MKHSLLHNNPVEIYYRKRKKRIIVKKRCSNIKPAFIRNLPLQVVRNNFSKRYYFTRKCRLNFKSHSHIHNLSRRPRSSYDIIHNAIKCRRQKEQKNSVNSVNCWPSNKVLNSNFWQLGEKI